MHITIIGGGIAGTSAAAALAPHATVTLLEGETALGYHASGRSAAMFEENYGCDSVVALNKATGPVLEARGVLSPRNVLMAGLPGEEAAFQAEAGALGLKEITVKDARQMVPILSPDINQAAVHIGASDIDTDKLIQGFAKQARENGATIRTGARVSAITRNGRWQITLGDETLTTDILVNAAGAWADQIAQMAEVAPVGLTPLRRSFARLPAPGGHDVSGWPMLFGPGESWYAKPDAGAWNVSPAEEDPIEPMDAWADDMVIAEGLARYETHVTEPVTRVETTWAGLRTFAPDRTLVIGEDPAQSGFFWHAGQGGYGFQTSVGAAEVLKHHLLGGPRPQEPWVIDALHPARFAS